MIVTRKIRPDNGYCLFIPGRASGKRFVAGRSVRVLPWEEWKHVRLGLFHVSLPGKDELLVTTSEQLTCGVRARFSIVIGGPEEGREERLAKATISCPAKRSVDPKDRIELVPFFHDWAVNYCKTAIINIVKTCNYVELLEAADYRQASERKIEVMARETLASIGMMLVECTVILEPSEPNPLYATDAILQKWQRYRRSVSDAAIAKLLSDNEEDEQRAKVNAEHEARKQKISEAAAVELRRLTQERKQGENAIEILEERELDAKDRQISEIRESVELRAQDTQRARIAREADLERERVRQRNELALLEDKLRTEALQRQQERLQLERRVAERDLELQELKQKLTSVEVELLKAKGEVSAANTSKEVLARGALDLERLRLLYQVLPIVSETSARAIEKIGEIKIIALPGGAPVGEQAGTSGGSIYSSILALPVVRELFRAVGEMEQSSRSENTGS